MGSVETFSAKSSLKLAEIVGRQPVIPVLRIDRVGDAVPMVKALAAGGLSVVEVTFRTPDALDSVKRIVANVPEVQVGVGTVRDHRQFQAAKEAGAVFAVSPGFTPSLLAGAVDADLPWLPGVETVSEAMVAAELGFDRLKKFPASLAWLEDVYGPLSELKFCPTGGVKAGNANQYLGLPNVWCVGGSWPADRKLVQAKNWSGIETLAREAVRLRD